MHSVYLYISDEDLECSRQEIVHSLKLYFSVRMKNSGKSQVLNFTILTSHQSLNLPILVTKISSETLKSAKFIICNYDSSVSYNTDSNISAPL